MASNRTNQLHFFIVIISIFVACNPVSKKRGEQNKQARETGETGTEVGKVSAVRSPVWRAGSLFAESRDGKKRDLAPGDTLSLGEILHTKKSLRAELELAHQVTLEIHEDTSVAFKIIEKNPGIEFLTGEALISRPLGEQEPFHVQVGENVLKVDHGRLFLSQKDDKSERVVARVDAGDIFWANKGRHIPPGQELIIDSKISISDKAPSPMTPEIPLPPLPEPLTSLTPESMRIPIPTTVQRGIGTLTARAPGSGQTSENALDLVKHLVKVTIRDGIALTQVEESFTNHSGRTVEGTYRFMLPGNASITRLALDVGGRIEEGEVLEKERAKRIFKKIVEDSVRPRDPALLEWERGSSFSMKIFPIKGKETRTVYLSYMQPLTYRDGIYQYVYPLGGPAGAPEVGHFEIQTEMDMQQGVGEIRTPLYESAITVDNKRVSCQFKAEKFAPAADYILQFTPQNAPPELRVASQTAKDGTTYAMALINPKFELETMNEFSRMVIVLDTSYGVAEDVLSLARATILELLAGARGQDEFALLACDSGCRALSTDFLKPSRETLTKAEDFLTHLEPGGASDILGALSTGFSLLDDDSPGSVIYFGDGVPTAGETNLGNLKSILEKLIPQSVSLHTVGIGPNMDTLSLEVLANNLRGASYAIAAGETPIAAAAHINRILRSETITDVTIEWPRGVEASYPSRVGSLPLGQELPVFAALKGSQIEGDLTIRGRRASGHTIEKSYPIRVSASDRAPGFISRLFAKAHIDYLSLQPGNDRQIIDLSRRMRVASRLTSWIVLENQRMYKEFNVERTDAEDWQGEPAQFEAVPEADEDEVDDMTDLEISSKAGAAPQAARGFSGGMGSGSLGAAPSRAAPKSKKTSRPPARLRRMETIEESMPDVRSDRFIRPEDYITPPPPHLQPRYAVTIKPPAEPGPALLTRLEQLRAEVQKYPLRRSNHQRLLRHLARLGRVDDAVEAAESWRKIDPLSTSALRAYADNIARSGQRNRAVRMYASLAELQPNAATIHLRLAEAMEDLGRFDGAAAHYRAAAFLKGGKQTAVVQYLSCLIGARQLRLYEIESRRIKENPALRKVHQLVENLSPAKDIISGTNSSQLASSRTTAGPGLNYTSRRDLRGDLQIRLELPGAEADLDIAVIDPTGRRISGIWRRDASSNFLTHPNTEQLAIHKLRVGNYHIVVSRTDREQKAALSGKLHIKAKNKRRTVPFRLIDDEIKVATVGYQQTMPAYR